MKKKKWSQYSSGIPVNSQSIFPYKIPGCKPVNPRPFFKAFALHKGAKMIVKYLPVELSIWRKEK